MERLTQKTGEYLQDAGINYLPRKNNGDYFGIVNKLGELEDLEEQGLLLKLPCKVGTMVYEVYEFGLAWEDWQVDQHPISLEDIPKFGKTVFLTEAEAEKALEEKGCE